MRWLGANLGLHTSLMIHFVNVKKIIIMIDTCGFLIGSLEVVDDMTIILNNKLEYLKSV